VSVGPVAHVLADLAELLGLPADVRDEHRAHGDRVAQEVALRARRQPKTRRSRRR
jgi:hypothetical protein